MRIITHNALIRRTSLAFVASLAACGGGEVTGGDRATPLTLTPRETVVRTQQVTTATIVGARLTAANYNGALGLFPVVAGRVNDSTLSFIIPAAPAGAQALSFTVGTTVVQATIQVETVAAVSDPVAYVARADSLFNTSLAAAIVAAANSPFGRTAADSAAFTADLQRARSARVTAQAAFAALSPAEQQELANILRATLEAQPVSPRVASTVAVAATQIDICQYKDIPKTVEEMRECQLKQLSALERIKARAEDCRAASVAAAGIRASIRTALLQIVNFCHVARLAEYSAEQWEAAEFIVVPTFPTTLEELLTPITEPFEDEESLRPGTDGSSVSARVLRASTPMVFGAGVTRTLVPRVRFRPFVTSDVGRIPAATQAASLLNTLATAWRALNSYGGGLLGREPGTLTTATNPRSRALRYSPRSALRLGRVQPQAIRWNWLATVAGIELRFDIDDKSADVPFTYDLIYDAGAYGADTVTVSAVLTRDSVPIYAAAALGRWTVTTAGPVASTFQADFKENGIATGFVLRPISESCGTGADRSGDRCVWTFYWHARSFNGRYYIEPQRFSGNAPEATPVTLPLTGFTTFFNGIPFRTYRKN